MKQTTTWTDRCFAANNLISIQQKTEEDKAGGWGLTRRTPVRSSLLNITQVPQLKFRVILIHYLSLHELYRIAKTNNINACLVVMQHEGFVCLLVESKVVSRERVMSGRTRGTRNLLNWHLDLSVDSKTASSQRNLNSCPLFLHCLFSLPVLLRSCIFSLCVRFLLAGKLYLESKQTREGLVRPSGELKLRSTPAGQRVGGGAKDATDAVLPAWWFPCT